MGLLVQREFLPENILPEKIRFPKELPYIRNWGIYSSKERIGYLKNVIIAQPYGYLWKNEAEIRLFEDMPISINAITVFSIDETLKNFRIILRYEDFIINLAGTLKKDILRLKVKTGTGESAYSLPWFSNTDIMGNTLIPWFYKPNLKVGDKFQWYLLNPLTHSKDLVKAVVRRASFYYNKKDFVPVMVVSMHYQDMKLEFWIDNDGDPLKVVTPWGWELEME